MVQTQRLNITVTIEDVNDNAPVFTSIAHVTIDENTTAVTTYVLLMLIQTQQSLTLLQVEQMHLALQLMNQQVL